MPADLSSSPVAGWECAITLDQDVSGGMAAQAPSRQLSSRTPPCADRAKRTSVPSAMRGVSMGTGIDGGSVILEVAEHREIAVIIERPAERGAARTGERAADDACR